MFGDDLEQPCTLCAKQQKAAPTPTTNTTVEEPPVLKLSVEGYRLRELFDDMLARTISDLIGGNVEHEVRRAVATAAQDAVKKLTEEAIRAVVTEILVKGWKETNNYGEPTGKSVTVSSLVLSYLTGKADSYKTERRIDNIIKELGETTIRKELEPIVAEAKEKLRALFDGAIAKKLRATLADLLKE